MFILYHLVWLGAPCSGMVVPWYSVAWYDVPCCAMLWSASSWRAMAWCVQAGSGMAWYTMQWHCSVVAYRGLVLHGMACCDMVCFGMQYHAMSLQILAWLDAPCSGMVASYYDVPWHGIIVANIRANHREERWVRY